MITVWTLQARYAGDEYSVQVFPTMEMAQLAVLAFFEDEAQEWLGSMEGPLTNDDKLKALAEFENMLWEEEIGFYDIAPHQVKIDQ